MSIIYWPWFYLDADLLYETLRRVNIDYLTAGDQATKFVTENLKKKVAVLHNLLNLDDSKTQLSHRDDHPEWFRGLETNVTTKEAYMHRRCQDRIRGYLYKTIEQIKTSNIWLTNNQARLNLQNIIEYFKLQLKKDHYFGYYFDRSKCHKDEIDAVTRTTDNCYDHCPCKLIDEKKNDEDDNEDVNEKYVDEEKKIDDDNVDTVDGKRQSKSNDRPAKKQEIDETIVCPYNVYSRCQDEINSLCDANGEFQCEGVWNYENCKYGDRHKINPYRSKEELILFSTWNLDHKLERSRTLVPQLLKYSEDNLINEKIVFKFYDNLFTIKNLRLVHIVCHDKGSHK
ncbi:DNA fragmentation factor subunit beta isoform X2 [Aphidius gifuensis]|uniref:DNA fragmentation factor subunit beta isoform X2 n=1 Tax=Aphidius gifuensis TaxID=684658 RepID=UPI001CDB68B3|nr:DNA fragmentation factor subunit beta isoform X2 [Aphidius gifuensis]